MMWTSKLSLLLLCSLLVSAVLETEGADCQLTFTVDANALQSVCPAQAQPPLGIGQSGIQEMRDEMARIQHEMAELKDEHTALKEQLEELEQETRSWREIIEWPMLEPIFAPDNDTLYIDPDGPTYKDCQAAVARKQKQGIYSLKPGTSDKELPFLAYCDEDGWTVIQRRFDGSLDFYRNWNDYMSGFGRLGGEFWLGLDNVYRLTNQQDSYSIRIEALGYNNKLYYSENPNFKLKSEADEYVFVVGNRTEGNYKDLVAELNGVAFTTHDNDNDGWWDANCAYQYRGAFWLQDCGWDLNREYCDGQGCMKYGDRTIKKSVIKMKVTGDNSPPTASRTPKKNKKQRRPRKERG